MSRTPDATRAGGTLAWAIGGSVVPPEVGEVAPSLWLADWDGDGRTDILTGTRSVGLGRYLPRKGPGFGVGWNDGTWLFRDMTATVWLHRNVGTKTKPVFSAGNLVTTRSGRAITFFDRAQPMAVDWNGAGKLDLLVGAFDRLVLFLNVREPKHIRLRSTHPGWGHFAMCEPVDFDGDGQWEALAGVDRGHIHYWRE